MPAKIVKPKVAARLPAAAKRASSSPSPANHVQPIYKRILLKLSGESFQGPQGFGIHGETIQAIARELKDVHALGVETAIMVGGETFFAAPDKRDLKSIAPRAILWACWPR